MNPIFSILITKPMRDNARLMLETLLTQHPYLFSMEENHLAQDLLASGLEEADLRAKVRELTNPWFNKKQANTEVSGDGDVKLNILSFRSEAQFNAFFRHLVSKHFPSSGLRGLIRHLDATCGTGLTGDFSGASLFSTPVSTQEMIKAEQVSTEVPALENAAKAILEAMTTKFSSCEGSGWVHQRRVQAVAIRRGLEIETEAVRIAGRPLRDIPGCKIIYLAPQGTTVTTAFYQLPLNPPTK